MKHLKTVSKCATLALVLLPGFLFGQVISEVMYDLEGTDSGREWIEIYNDSQDSFGIGDLAIFENDINHGFSTINGDEAFAPGEYLIIASNDEKFILDYPSYGGPLVDSVFSLSNVGEELALTNTVTGDMYDVFSYLGTDGAAGNGNSLHRNSNNDIVEAKASPGSGQIDTVSEGGSGSEQGNANGTDSSGESSGSTASDLDSNQVIKKNLPLYRADFDIAEEVGVHESLYFNVITQKLEKDDDSYRSTKKGFYRWYFGDGEVIELQEDGPVYHSYLYPGNYTYTLEYYPSANSEYFTVPPSLVKSGKIIVHENIFSLSEYSKGEYIEIKNNMGSQKDLHDWRVQSGVESFKFPKYTYIEPGASRKISYRKLGFADISDVAQLYYPSGQHADYLRYKKEPSGEVISSVANNISVDHNKQEDQDFLSEQGIADTKDSVEDINKSIRSSKSQILFIWTIRVVGAICFSLAILLAYLLKKEKRQIEKQERYDFDED